MTAFHLEHLAEELQRWAEIAATDPANPKLRARRRILEAATELFERYGYRKTNVDDVARHAGVAKGSVYLYFKSKAELLLHAVGAAKMEFIGGLAPFVDDQQLPDPTARLEAYLAAGFRVVIEVPLLARLMSGDRELLVALEELGPTFHEQLLQAQGAFLTEILTEVPGADPDTLDEDVQVILGLLYAAPQIMDSRARGNISHADYARMLARLIVEGVNR